MRLRFCQMNLHNRLIPQAPPIRAEPFHNRPRARKGDASHPAVPYGRSI